MNNLICVDKGALKMALNILERGSDLHKEAAEALKQSCSDHIQQLEAVLKEADEYLDINELTSIGHGSILHRKFKELLKEKEL